MSFACTLVSPIRGYAEALEAIRGSNLGELAIQGDLRTWKRIEIQILGGVLAFTSLVRKKPGDKFSKLTLSMHSFFRNVETDATGSKEFVLKRIADAEMFIGVVANDLREEGSLDCIWAVAECLNAIVFSGEAMLNARGERLLDQTGMSDVTV
jgi:hypothetical protein